METSSGPWISVKKTLVYQETLFVQYNFMTVYDNWEVMGFYDITYDIKADDKL